MPPNQESGHIEQLSILKDDIISKVSICIDTTELNTSSCRSSTFSLWFVTIIPKEGFPREVFLWKWNVYEIFEIPKKNFAPYGWSNATISNNGTRICLDLFNLSLVAAGKEFKVGLRCNTTRWGPDERYFKFKEKG